jgi:DNA-binding IclR family transcriptional regulator
VTRVSPAALRTVAVLDLFGSHPGQSFTLTEIARALKMNQATCLSILMALVESNYLMRATDKSYMSGPALARLGASAAALDANPLQLALPEMRRLADEMDAICSAIFPEGNEAVVRERAASASHLGWAAHLHRRFPLHPPYGSVFMAWADDQSIMRWINRVQPPPGGEQRDAILSSLDFCRREGFTLGLRTEPVRGEAHAQALSHRTDKTDYLVSDVHADTRYDLAFVAAPVFDRERKVVFALAMTGFVRAVDAGEVRRVGRALRTSCDFVTRSIGGAEPDTGATLYRAVS